MAKEKWTSAQIPNLDGKVAIVTGANSGTGFEVAKAFAAQQATVILACRSTERGAEALARLRAEVPQAKAELMHLDLGDLKCVRAFAKTFQEKYSRLDILANNAGLTLADYTLTKDGFEAHIGVNYLGPFALTGLLLPILKNTPQARVVSMSSIGHRQGVMDFDDFLFEGGKGFEMMRAYGRSKLANLLFTYELQRRFEAHNIPNISVAAHPGASKTNLNRDTDRIFFYKYLLKFMNLVGLMQEANMGALPMIRAAVDVAVKGGEYYGPGGIGETVGHPIQVTSSPVSYNAKIAKQLWKISEKLTGVHYDFT